MSTIGRRWPSSAPRGDRQAMCSYCGVQWRLSQLRRDRSGNWYCPDEGNGLDVKSLDEANAAGAREPNATRANGGAPWDRGSNGSGLR